MVLCILIVPGNDVEHKTVTPISLIISIYTPHHIASHHNTPHHIESTAKHKEGQLSDNSPSRQRSGLPQGFIVPRLGDSEAPIQSSTPQPQPQPQSQSQS
jgi:hypothetical protein